MRVYDYVLVRWLLYVSNLISIWSVLVGNTVMVRLLLAGTATLDTEALLCRLGDCAAAGEGGDSNHDIIDFDGI